MAKYFGTDGIRGKANQLLTPELALRLGQAAALLARDSEPRRLLIGKDTRISGDMLEAALAAGLMSAGVEVLLLGIIPTPGVAALCRAYGAPGAVISASHNPYYDNGIKFFSAKGLKLPDEVQEQLEGLMDNPAQLQLATEILGRQSRVEDACRQYSDFLLQKQQPDLSGLKLVVDCSHGAASPLAASLLRGLGAQVTELFARPNGYNINEGCGSTHPEALRKTLVEQGADLGLALDGDADRLLVVDEDGRLLDGDMLLAIMARHMRSKGCLANDTVVVTQMCNMALRLGLEEQGIKVVESKVGDRYVLEQMLRHGACLGGEHSGHLILKDYNSTGDALAAALYLLTIVQEERQSLGELSRDLRLFPQIHLNVPVKSQQGYAEDEEIGAAIALAEQKLAGQGRVVVRASGTEPLFRVMAEGPEEALLQELSQNIAAAISRKLG